jgi:hypothetical protein
LQPHFLYLRVEPIQKPLSLQGHNYLRHRLVKSSLPEDIE